MMENKRVVIDYTNWRGERRTRTIIPTGLMMFEANEWHPTPQWLFGAHDPEDGKFKLYAMSGVHFWRSE
jgi:predicted DNA-binding transcriptional regulator YafY